MDWYIVLEGIGIVITVGFLIALLKELKKNIKESNDGKQSKRCSLD